MNTPVRNPINDPIAAFNAFLLSDGSWKSSPISAPKKVPIKIPKGPINTIPTTRPAVEPIIPDFVQPNFLAPNIGIK